MLPSSDGGARASSDVVPDADQALQCASAPELSVSAPPAPIPEPGATELATGLAMGSPLVPVPGPGATELAMGLAMGPPLAPAPGLKPAPGLTIQGLAIPAMPPIEDSRPPSLSRDERRASLHGDLQELYSETVIVWNGSITPPRINVLRVKSWLCPCKFPSVKTPGLRQTPA